LVRPRGYLEDEGILDDIERLLDIIAKHVERMRQAGGITTNNDIGYGGNNDNGDRVSYNTTIYNSNTTSVNHTECIGQGVCNPVHVDSHDSGGKIDDKDKDKAKGEEEGKACEEKRKKNLRIKEMVPGKVPDAQEIVRIANQAGLGGLERHG
jgi:ferredoxin